MSATTFVFSFIEYSKGARKKKRRDVTLEDDGSEKQKKAEPKIEPEIEIGRETISRDGFFPTEVRTPARKDPTRDFKMRIEFTAERAEFFPMFVPGNLRKPSLEISRDGEQTLSLEEGEEGILCILEHAEDGALQFTMFELWDPVHITSIHAISVEKILGYFSRSPRYGAVVEKFFEEELKRAERSEKEQKHKKGLLERLASLKRGGWLSR